MNVELPRQFLEQVIYFIDLHREFEWHFYEPHFKIWDNVNELFITIVMLYYSCAWTYMHQASTVRSKRRAYEARVRTCTLWTSCDQTNIHDS